MDTPRLIEYAFPLKQASLDSVHEKNVRHGHISTLHIWPARRPLAACRAALIATLLPDPSGEPKPDGMSEDEWQKEIVRRRQELCEKIGGRVVKKLERKKMPNGQIVEREKEVTEGGILHWGRETENKEDLEWFRQEIRKAYGGRAPKVLDPFAGGGAIPLEAMRLGCEATAVDINPVAWFILKCTLEYPQKLAGKTFPLPDFILKDEEFMESFYKAHPQLIGRTKITKKQKDQFSQNLFLKDKKDSGRAPKADLAWHVRAWGQWVLNNARKELARFYPTYADFEPLDQRNPKPYESQPMRLVPLRKDGNPDIGKLNIEFSKEYLTDKRNPRWIVKPTVAYLWARSVKCKNCRATIPLLKTQWLCKREKKRILLTMEPNAEKIGVIFGIEKGVPAKGSNTAQRREHDRRIGGGTMSRSGAKCPCCGTIMTMEDIRLEGQAGKLSSINSAVVVDGQRGKEYRLPQVLEIDMARDVQEKLHKFYTLVPLGLPEEPLASKEALGFRVPLYGLDRWRKLFTARQLAGLGAFVGLTRMLGEKLFSECPSPDLRDGIFGYLGICVSRLSDSGSTLCHWQNGGEFNVNTFQRFALPISWDFSEVAFCAGSSGSYSNALGWVALVAEHVANAVASCNRPKTICQSSAQNLPGGFDCIITDPPYYDAIPYSDCMDFFYVWLRRVLLGISADIEPHFKELLSPKWDHHTSDGEIIDDASRYGGDKARSKAGYEEAMARVFQKCHSALTPEGKLVVVFAHKQPDAWETLVSAMIRAGFVADASWPIQTERSARTRSLSSAALSSSVWLVCKKRSVTIKPGWDNKVLEDMRRNIRKKLRDFWDAGIRGPDFVWAATGPALEAYSKYPVVKKANEPGLMSVSEFLTHARRMVVDFVVGRVLSGDDALKRKREERDDIADPPGDYKPASLTDAPIGELDQPTAYYLLHRHDFGLEDAPAGACILYAISCGLSDKQLADTWDLISFTKGKSQEEADEAVADPDAEVDSSVEEESGSKVKLKTWVQRKRRSLGFEAPGGRPIPLIDRIHCLMHLWRGGDLHRVDEYLDGNGLRRHELFRRLLQSLIELSPHGSEERSLLESLSNHIQAKGVSIREEQVSWLSGQTKR